MLFVSLTIFGLGILLAGFVIITHFKREPEPLPASEVKPPDNSAKP